MSASDGTTTPGAETIGAEQLASAGNWLIGEAQVSFGTLLVRLGGQESRLTPKAMGVLLALARKPGETLSRDQLLDLVWPGDYPTQDVLSHAIRELRRALGDQMPHPARIQTVPRIGYRLEAPVRRFAGKLDHSEPESFEIGGLAATTSARDHSPAPDLAEQPPRRLRPIPVLLVGCLSLLATSLVWKRWRVPMAPDAPAVSAEKLLTSSLLAERMPSISNDGKRFAFVEFDEHLEHAKIVVASMDSGERRVVSIPEKKENNAPQWSRDGSMLTFQSSSGNNCGISLVTLNGLDVTSRRYLGTCRGEVIDMVDWAVGDKGLWLTRAVGENAKATQIVLRDLQGVDHPLDYQRQAEDYDRDPRQSPDGRWIAFRRGVQPQGALCLVSSGGGQVRVLTESKGYFGRFDWYPDSRHLLISNRVRDRLVLYRLDTESRALDALPIHDADNIDIAQGANLAIFEHVRIRRRIREYSLNGSGVAQRWRVPSTGSEPEAVYDAAGTRIAFISDRSGSAQIWLTSAQEDQPRQLTRFQDAQLHDLSFSANGGELVWVHRDDVAGEKVCLLDLKTDQSVEKCSTLAHAEIRSARRLASAHRLAYSAPTANGWAAFVIDLREPVKSLHVVAGRNGIDPNLQVSGDAVYLTDPARGEILRVESPYEVGRIVLDVLPAWQASRWRIADAAAWYAWADLQAGNFKLYRTELTPASMPKEILDLGPDRAYPLLDVSSDASRALVQTELADETDIAMIDLLDWKPAASH